MRRSDRHLPEPSCRAGLIMFDGGEVSLASHEIWALCDSTGCSHPGCTASPAAPGMFRVRSLRDLEKHLGSSGTAKVVVAEKGSLPEHRTPDLLNPNTPLPSPEHRYSIAARGEISLERARRRGGFTLSPDGSRRLDTFLTGLKPTRFAGDRAMVLARMKERTNALVEIHGEHRVLTELTRFHTAAGERGAAPGILLAAAEEALASRDHAERLYRGYERDTFTKSRKVADLVEVVPGKPLAMLKPKKGTLVGDSLHVVLPTDEHRSAHLLARLATRGYELLGPTEAMTALSPSATPSATRTRLPETKEKLSDLAETLRPRIASLLAEGVFASGVQDPPVDDAMLSRVAGTGTGSSRPRLASNRVRVTVPSPVSPSEHLTFVLEVVETKLLNRDGRTKTVAAVVPVTVLSPTRINDADDTEPFPRPAPPPHTRFAATPDPRPNNPLGRHDRNQRRKDTDELVTGNELRMLKNLGITPPVNRPHSRSSRPGPPSR